MVISGLCWRANLVFQPIITREVSSMATHHSNPAGGLVRTTPVDGESHLQSPTCYTLMAIQPHI